MRRVLVALSVLIALGHAPAAVRASTGDATRSRPPTHEPTITPAITPAITQTVTPTIAPLAGTEHAHRRQEGAASCLRHWGEARARAYGYSHVVVIDNGCSEGAHCEVSTDVNPQVQTVTVAAKSVVEVVTFLESPVSAFTPKVTCHFPK